MSTQGREPIAVIGAGYVGLVTGAGFAELGNDVVCVDIDAERVERLNRGEVPIHEPGLEDVLERNRERLSFTTDLAAAVAESRLLFVAVGTPPTHSGDADLSAVESVIDALPTPAEGDGGAQRAIVMKSTVPVGTGNVIRRTLARQGKEAYAYVSCPEFLREGSALADFRKPDRVVIGDDGGWAGDAVEALYAPLGAPTVRTDVASAEMVKLASNAFLATKISFINEIANVCEETGADVSEVARGMGLDQRIGGSFLNPGLGYGGSCFAGEETALVRWRGRISLMPLKTLFERLLAENEGETDDLGDGVECVPAPGVSVLSWHPELGDQPRFMPLMLVSRRDYDGEMIEIRTKMGRRLTVTPDHPILVGDGLSSKISVKLARDLTTDDWVPLAQGGTDLREDHQLASVMSAVEAAQVEPHKLLVRPPRERLGELVSRPLETRREVFTRHDTRARTGEVKRTGILRLDELAFAGLPIEGSRISTTKNGNWPTSEITLDQAFWRVVGLYIAEGCAVDKDKGAQSLIWSFHPTREQHLVDEVVAFWTRHGVSARVRDTGTSRAVFVSGRLTTTWWIQTLGLGRNAYEQRLPDLIWERPDEDKWALLSAFWEGDGSWSLVNGGPSVILEMGTISDELADGVMRLIGDLGLVASRRVGRVAKSTKDTHWVRISGADQIEKAIDLVPKRDRVGVLSSIARQQKRIKATGYRRFDGGPVWLRVASLDRRQGPASVYSMEVPVNHTFVATGGFAVHQCFPKDVSALKQLAGNSGYHFQLLNAVIEVNELQKRRVISKLEKHLGELAGKKVALLGLAFKPDTDDMREASSIVLAGRLLAEGAEVRAYDPVVGEDAGGLLRGVSLCGSALDAVQGADAVVLVTEWAEFAQLDPQTLAGAMAGRLVIDGRNALDGDALAAAGFTYEGVGRS
jgi:UDPglucose 6-dehydrogenase